MCLDDALLNSYLDGELQEPWKTQVEEHIAYCKGCRQRLEELQALDKRLKAAVESDEEIARRSARVMTYFEKNRFNRQPHTNIFKRKVQVKLVPTLIASAAAFVVIFIGSFVLFGTNNRQTSQILPEVMMPISSSQVQQVSEKQKTTLDDFSLEEIVQYLDSKGYAVQLQLKSIAPIPEKKNATADTQK
ncbi:MAG: zf-HC2 domain-containing protein [Spirochaetia bacterium]|jgi:predicted anti-sigma-YlaC factor YlaD|nr:zf-HC2 domain-containing protein [Spirochaetia bacterium]